MRRTIATFVGLAAIALAAAGSAPAGASPGDGRSSSEADQHRRVVEYWTADRRASAVPRDFNRPSPAARPDPGGGGGGGGSVAVTGATWTGGGSVTKTTGKVFFNLGATRYTCSASAVQGGGGNLVVTAGHCVHDGNNGAFATNWIFYPGWNGAPSPSLGAWTATDLFTTPGWASAGDFDDDLGLAVVTGGAGSPSLGATLTSAGATVPGIAFDTSSGTVSAFGYPASKKYKGNTLTYCAGDVRARYDGNNTMALTCDMTGGSSGGPWFKPFANGAGDAIVSLNSYGYASLSNTMFGPIFDSAESAMYSAVKAATDCAGNTAVYRCDDQAD